MLIHVTCGCTDYTNISLAPILKAHLVTPAVRPVLAQSCLVCCLMTHQADLALDDAVQTLGCQRVV